MGFTIAKSSTKTNNNPFTPVSPAACLEGNTFTSALLAGYFGGVVTHSYLEVTQISFCRVPELRRLNLGLWAVFSTYSRVGRAGS
jgi:hypothetical protein